MTRISEQRNYCYKCGALEEEAPREKCTNPAWHEGYVREAKPPAAIVPMPQIRPADDDEEPF